ncbi:alpha/beta fold hydrolase [Kribbella sp. NPDC055071]
MDGVLSEGQVQVGERVVRYSVYGTIGGPPVLSFAGSPSTRWKRPADVAAIETAGVWMVTLDRPGYGGSTRQPGRTVASAAADAEVLADALGWNRFAVTGGSGGGPRALACAALLPDHVTRCAVIGSNAPPIAGGPVPTEDDLHPQLQEHAQSIMALIEAGGPEIPPDPESPPGPPARDNANAMARVTATFVTSHDGWLDDHVAFATHWGFDLAGIHVPVSIWYGSTDERAAGHADVLAAGIPGAARMPYTGGHIPPTNAYRNLLDWLKLS